MSDPLGDIAAELGRLRPLQASERLTRRLEVELDSLSPSCTEPVARPFRARWTPWAMAAGLALIAILMVARQARLRPRMADSSPSAFQDNPPSLASQTLPTGQTFRPVDRANHLQAAEDDGLVYGSGTAPWRKVWWRYLSTCRWRDDQDNTTFQVLMPREEVVLMPVSVD